MARTTPPATRTPPPSLDGAEVDPASFRDPAGFVFRRNGILYRQVQPPAAPDWAAFQSSGLYARLVAGALLVEHADVSPSDAARPDAVAVIRPRELELISYPYEWCFTQLQEAALLTLDLQARSLDSGMRLRDASAYNVQFEAGRPIFIDSLSFEVAPETEPWPAYRQFCEHFLAPLALMAHRDARCGVMLRDFIDGVPLDLAAALLPWRTRLNVGMSAHVHLHARAQRRAAADAGPAKGAGRAPRISATGQRALLDSLRRTVAGLRVQPGGHWADYASTTSYSDAATASKGEIVRSMLVMARGRTVWDLGANTGVYSAVATRAGYRVVAFDQDASSVEAHWRHVRGERNPAILPLVLDLTNPSPSLGWGLRERRSFLERGEPDAMMALALIHHLAIGNNVPLERIADLFALIAPRAIVEFVPKEDPMTQRLLAARPDIFANYTIGGFRDAFGPRFRTVRESPISNSPRTLFLLERR